MKILETILVELLLPGGIPAILTADGWECGHAPSLVLLETISESAPGVPGQPDPVADLAKHVASEYPATIVRQMRAEVEYPDDAVF